jgi:CubicO group peptidase (beta-lactamase class C family)
MRRFDDIEEAMRHFSDDPLLFEPGRYWSYSSHAFNLLQGVIEKASGMRFEDYMRKNVWEPAGMLQSSFDVPERIVHKRGQGYVRNSNGVLVHPRYADVSYKYAGGGMLSTVVDLVRFGNALNDHTLLTPETAEKMYTIAVDPVVRFQPDGKHQKGTFKQALGWRIYTDAQGRPYINHTGTVRGTRSFMLNYPDEGLVLALQANVLPFDSRKYGAAIAQMFLSPSSSHPHSPKPAR